MNENHKCSESDRCVCYKKKDNSSEMTMIFNKDIKTVDISASIFIRNDEPMFEPMENEWVKHSAKYGYWQQISPTLGIEDITFLYEKSRELFGKSV